MINHYNFEVKLDTYKLKYKRPRYSIQQCIKKSKTYTIPVYLPLEIKYKGTTIIKNKYLLIGEIPLMTEKGNFIINGNTRVIVNQIIRSPGLYFKKNKNEDCATATIIPNQGSWITIKIDKKDEIYAKIDKQKKIPIISLLQSIGFTKKKLVYTLNDSKVIENLNKKEKIYSPDKNNSIFNELTKDSHINVVDIKSSLGKKFMDETRYDLGENGRSKINNKIYKKDYWRQTRTLNPEDILYCIKYLIKLKQGIGHSDDIDNLKNKRIRQSGELLQNQVKMVINDIMKGIKEKLEKVEEDFANDKKQIKITEIINHHILTNAMKKFFTTNQLSQLMEETNPLAEITQKRKVSSFGIGAIDKKKANLNVREIHPSQYGKICPIETTDGKNAGLILSLSKDARINEYGFIETPYYD